MIGANQVLYFFGGGAAHRPGGAHKSGYLAAYFV